MSTSEDRDARSFTPTKNSVPVTAKYQLTMGEPARAQDRRSPPVTVDGGDDIAGSPTEASPGHAEHSTRWIELASWLLCPALFVAACWSLLLAPKSFCRWLPRPKYAWLLAGPHSRSDDASVLLTLSKSPHRCRLFVLRVK